MLVHVLEHPPASWDGETGLLTPEIMDRHLLPPDSDRQYFVCGPAPSMDLAEQHFRRRSIPMRSILSERFQIV